jgi:RNA polymerase sigma factor (sigma-70 family)
MRALPASPSADFTGEVPTLDAVYRAHAEQVGRWIAHLGGPSVDVDDLVHEVFLVAQRRLREFRGESKLASWLYQITRRVVQGARRRTRLQRWIRWARGSDIARAPPEGAPGKETASVDGADVNHGLGSADHAPELHQPNDAVSDR